MRRVDSLEKTLMLGGTGGRRRRGWQRKRWLDGIMDLMDTSLSELRWTGRPWLAAVHGVAKSRTRLSDWTELNWPLILLSAFGSVMKVRLDKSIMQSNATISFFLTLLAMPHGMWILIPWPGTESGPLLWKQEVFTTGPPGKSRDFHFFSCDFSTALIYQTLCLPKCCFKDRYTFPVHTSESVLRVGCFLFTQTCR